MLTKTILLRLLLDWILIWVNSFSNKQHFIVHRFNHKILFLTFWNSLVIYIIVLRIWLYFLVWNPFVVIFKFAQICNYINRSNTWYIRMLLSVDIQRLWEIRWQCEMIYNALFMLYIQYGILLWGFKFDRLETIQRNV